MIAGWHQRAVDDPRFASVAQTWLHGERCDLRRHRRDDAVGGGSGDGEARGELADGEVRAQRGAREQDAPTARARPRAAPTRFGAETLEEHGQAIAGQGREDEQLRRGHRV